MTLKNNSSISLTDLVDCKHVRRSNFDDGTYCSKCESSSEGWCSDTKSWCYKVKGKCDKNLAYQSEKLMNFKLRKSS